MIIKGEDLDHIVVRDLLEPLQDFIREQIDKCPILGDQQNVIKNMALQKLACFLITLNANHYSPHRKEYIENFIGMLRDSYERLEEGHVFDASDEEDEG